MCTTKDYAYKTLDKAHKYTSKLDAYITKLPECPLFLHWLPVVYPTNQRWPPQAESWPVFTLAHFDRICNCIASQSPKPNSSRQSHVSVVTLFNVKKTVLGVLEDLSAPTTTRSSVSHTSDFTLWLLFATVRSVFGNSYFWY